MWEPVSPGLRECWGKLSTLWDVAFARGYRLLGLEDLDAHRLGSGDRGRAHGGLFAQFDHELVGQCEGVLIETYGWQRPLSGLAWGNEE